jgi:hypothetical protein
MTKKNSEVESLANEIKHQAKKKSKRAKEH